MMVVVHGNSTSGRDAACQLLAEQYGYARYSLMTPVRDVLLTIDPLISSHTTLRSQVEPHGWDHVMSRPLYQSQVIRLLGTTARAFRSTFGQDVLVDLLISRVLDEHGGSLPEHVRVMVDDARHTDEVESLCSKMGARVLSVESKDGSADRLPDRLVTSRVGFELDDIDELAEQLEEVMGLRPGQISTGQSAD